MFQFIGKFHPLFVHLPIGIYIFGVILKGYSLFKKKDIEENIFKLIIISTLFFSVLSVASGLILFSGGNYEPDTVVLHRNVGIVFTIVTTLLYFFNQYKWSIYLWLFGLLNLSLTGHLGGSLTHGEDYLAFENPKSERKPISNIQDAIVYEELIKPIFEEKCLSCHSSKKQKGDLRLDQKIYITKGGKNGKCLDSAKSLLVKRLNLPIGEEEHMPPKGKPQLNENEQKIIEWWIKNGANFDKKVNQISQSEMDKKVLLSFQSHSKSSTSESIVPDEVVSSASMESLLILKKAGVVIFPVSEQSNYLSATIIETNLKDNEIKALLDLKKNLIVLNARGNRDQKLFQKIGEFENLRKLNLSKSDIKDQDIFQFSKLKNLVTLNISDTKITDKGLGYLKDLQNLKVIYIFNSTIDKKLFKNIKMQFPRTQIDTGGYKISEKDSLKFVI
jgi:ribosomal protein S16/uncharacterized membrane protein